MKKTITFTSLLRITLQFTAAILATALFANSAFAFYPVNKEALRPDSGGYGTRLLCILSDTGIASGGKPKFAAKIAFQAINDGQERIYSIEEAFTYKPIAFIRVRFDGTSVSICNGVNNNSKECAHLVGNYNLYKNGHTKQIISLRTFIYGTLSCSFY